MKTLKAATLAIVGLCAVAVAGCQIPKPPPMPSTQIAGQVSGQASGSEMEGYRLGTGDEIKVTVFNEPTLSGPKVVDGQGVIALEMIGDVSVKNLTTNEAQTMIEAKLKDGYLRDPRVTLELTKGRPYYILGEINKAGQYPFTSGLTVMNAIAAAGDFTYRADKRRVMVTSADSPVEKEIQLTPTTPVRPGDRIRIRERLF